MNSYFISQGATEEPIEVLCEGYPPCLWCGIPVESPSMDGPMVCVWCDCGVNRDYTRWIGAEFDEKRRHFSQSVDKYRKLHLDRKSAAKLMEPPTPAYLVGVSHDRWELRDALPLLPENSVVPGWVFNVVRQHRCVFAAGSREACEAAARLQNRFVAGACAPMSLAKELWL